MAYQPTTNFGWAMPRGGDQAQISVINQQFTAKADEIVYQTRRMIAPGYIDDGSKTYHEGDIVEYENVDYVCTGTTSGAWDSSKWDATDMATQIQEAKESGGTNVEANPVEAATADLHKLKVDTTVYGIPDPTVTKTATGNPIEISDGANAPLVKCVTEIQGSQDLHGYDKPWVGGAGKNKLPMTVSGVKALNTGGTWTGNTYSRHGLTIQLLTDNAENIIGIKISGTATSQLVFELGSISLTGTYTLTGAPPTGSNDTYALYIGSIYIWDYGSGATTTLTGATLPINIMVRSGYECPTGGLEFKPMLRLSTESNTFAPYSNICPITAYTEGEIEVRGKNLFGDVLSNSGANFVNEEFVNTDTDTFANFRPKIFLYKDGNAVYQWQMDTITSKGLYTVNIGYSKASYDEMQLKHNGSVRDLSVNVKLEASGVLTLSFYCESFNPTTVGGIVIKDIQVEKGSVTPYEPYTSTTHTTTYPSAIFRGSEDCVSGEVTTVWGMIASYAGEVLPGEWISDRDVYAPGTTPTTGAQVAYELAAPTTAAVTVSNTPIKSLAGYSNIESTTGDMEVEYITEEYQPLVDLIGGEYEETTLWSGTETASTSGSTLTLSDDVMEYDAIRIVCGGNGGQWLIPSTFSTGDLTVGGQYVGCLNDVVGANWYLLSTSSVKVVSISSGSPTTYTKVVGIKFGSGRGGSSYHVYSTDEHIVGTWIDGSILYERSIDLGSFSISSGGNHIIESATDIDLLIDYDGYMVESGTMYALPDPSVRIKVDSSHNLIFTGTSSWNVTSGYITIRYTKTSSNNRSLSKGATEEVTEKTVESEEKKVEEPIEEKEPEEKKEEVKEENER